MFDKNSDSLDRNKLGAFFNLVIKKTKVAKDIPSVKSLKQIGKFASLIWASMKIVENKEIISQNLQNLTCIGDK